MKRTLLALAASLALVVGAAAPALADMMANIHKAGQIRIGVSLGGEPIGFRDAQNNPVGYDVDVATMLAKALGVTPVFTDVSGDARISELVSGQLDVVVASVHSFFDLRPDDQTERIIRAMQNRQVSILGHPTGRLIGMREPYEIDMDRVTSAARELNCALEINAEPDRLDLNDLHAHMARAKGVKIAISTDAHSVNAFQYIRYGVDQARRGWLTAADVINTRPLAELRKLLKHSRSAAAA